MLILTLATSLMANPSPEQPNIVFFLSDDHACAAVGAYGSRINETPNIDRIADRAVVFDRPTSRIRSASPTGPRS